MHAFSMVKYPSIFQADFFAIFVCEGECLLKGKRGATIYILFVNQALVAYGMSSGLVRKCIDSLNRLDTGLGSLS